MRYELTARRGASLARSQGDGVVIDESSGRAGGCELAGAVSPPLSTLKLFALTSCRWRLSRLGLKCGSPINQAKFVTFVDV